MSTERLDLEAVIQQVETLYSCNDPAQINTIQQNLQGLQKSPYGYDLANTLLNAPSNNCKYFGALTFTVFISNHSHILSAANNNDSTDDNDNDHRNDANDNNNNELFARLINDLQLHLFQLINVSDPSLINSNLFIIRKLLSNVSLLFVSHFKSNNFENPIDALLSVLLSINNQPPHQDLANCISILPPHHIMILLTFYAILVEDISKKSESNDPSIHEIVFSHIFKSFVTTISYLSHLHSNSQSLLHSIDALALTAINSWVSYISIAESNSVVRYSHEDNSSIIQFIFIPFTRPPAECDDNMLELANQSIVVLTEIFEINPTMLDPQTKSFLKSILFDSTQWGGQFISSIVLDDDNRQTYPDEVNNFINLIIVSLQLDLVKFSRNLLDPNTQQILSILIKLTAIPGSPIIDESISELLLGFWEELANIFIDDDAAFQAFFDKDGDESARANFYGEISRTFNQVCSIYWSKIHLLPLSDLLPNKSEFLNYRSNVADFFILIYSLLKIPFYESLVTNLTDELALTDNSATNGESKYVLNVESTLYLLFKINEDCTFYESQSNALLPHTTKIFEKNLLGLYKSLPVNETSNSYHLSTLINYLSSIQFFFKTDQGQKFLGDVFDLLFSIILKSSNDKQLTSLSLITSKTILKICQECRSRLVAFLPTLEVVLVEMLKSRQLDHLIRQRMFNSFTSIAQCLSNPSDFATILHRTLQLINEPVLHIINSSPQLDEEQEDYLISLLTCVVEIGKGCQLPDEPEELYSPEQQQIFNDYWIQDPLQVKPLILVIIGTFSLKHPKLSSSSIVTEKCCLILKMGLGEPLNGPFNFNIEIIFQYLVTKMNNITNINSIPYIYSLVETIIILNIKDLNDVIINNLIQTIFTEHLTLLKSDPDLIKSSVDLFSTILEKKPSLILNSPIFNEVILVFAIDGLSAKETFIIKSVSKFWVHLISLKRGSQEDHVKVQELFQNNLEFTRFFLTTLLKSFVSTSRSNLDSYYPLFRQLVGTFPMILKKGLIHILSDSSEQIVNRDRIDDKYLETFINKLMVTRGQRAANDILKKFWLASNGLIEFNNQRY